MIYSYDCEFLEDGTTIDLISIGIVCEDGRELYLISSEFDQARAGADAWLREHVWPSLPTTGRRLRRPGPELDVDHPSVRTRAQIARAVKDFLLAADAPELWADCAAYDHVVLCQLWGRMIDLPEGLPMFTHDLQQMISVHGYVPLEQEAGQHNALEDARHVMRVLRKWRHVL